MREWEFVWRAALGDYDENCKDCEWLFDRAHAIGGADFVPYSRMLLLLGLSHEEILVHLLDIS